MTPIEKYNDEKQAQLYHSGIIDTSTKQTTRGNKMNKVDRKAMQEYKEDLAQEKTNEEYEKQEQRRIEWSQRHGNDSGFDPYWNM